jgi:3-hydroxybutyryl-CoA dehydratase
MQMNKNGIKLNDFDSIKLNMSANLERIIYEQDLINFAEVSGDTNPIHLNKQFAAKSIFGEQVSHGLLVASFISAVFGTIFPGPGWIYISQNIEFKAPVFIGDKVVVNVNVAKILKLRKMVEFKTIVTVRDKTVVNGLAVLKAP